MINRKFQSGSKPRRRKSDRLFCREKRISGKLSLADLSSGVGRMLRRLSNLNWINLLKVMKLVVEIAEKIRNLIFCQQTCCILTNGDDNKSYANQQ